MVTGKAQVCARESKPNETLLVIIVTQILAFIRVSKWI